MCTENSTHHRKANIISSASNMQTHLSPNAKKWPQNASFATHTRIRSSADIIADPICSQMRITRKRTCLRDEAKTMTKIAANTYAKEPIIPINPFDHFATSTYQYVMTAPRPILKLYTNFNNAIFMKGLLRNMDKTCFRRLQNARKDQPDLSRSSGIHHRDIVAIKEIRATIPKQPRTPTLCISYQVRR